MFSKRKSQFGFSVLFLALSGNAFGICGLSPVNAWATTLPPSTTGLSFRFTVPNSPFEFWVPRGQTGHYRDCLDVICGSGGLADMSVLGFMEGNIPTPPPTRYYWMQPTNVMTDNTNSSCTVIQDTASKRVTPMKFYCSVAANCVCRRIMGTTPGPVAIAHDDTLALQERCQQSKNWIEYNQKAYCLTYQKYTFCVAGPLCARAKSTVLSGSRDDSVLARVMVKLNLKNMDLSIWTNFTERPCTTTRSFLSTLHFDGQSVSFVGTLNTEPLRVLCSKDLDATSTSVISSSTQASTPTVLEQCQESDNWTVIGQEAYCLDRFSTMCAAQPLCKKSNSTVLSGTEDHTFLATLMKTLGFQNIQITVWTNFTERPCSRGFFSTLHFDGNAVSFESHLNTIAFRVLCSKTIPLTTTLVPTIVSTSTLSPTSPQTTSTITELSTTALTPSTAVTTTLITSGQTTTTQAGSQNLLERCQKVNNWIVSGDRMYCVTDKESPMCDAWLLCTRANSTVHSGTHAMSALATVMQQFGLHGVAMTIWTNFTGRPCTRGIYSTLHYDGQVASTTSRMNTDPLRVLCSRQIPITTTAIPTSTTTLITPVTTALTTTSQPSSTGSTQCSTKAVPDRCQQPDKWVTVFDKTYCVPNSEATFCDAQILCARTNSTVSSDTHSTTVLERVMEDLGFQGTAIVIWINIMGQPCSNKAHRMKTLGYDGQSVKLVKRLNTDVLRVLCSRTLPTTTALIPTSTTTFSTSTSTTSITWSAPTTKTSEPASTGSTRQLITTPTMTQPRTVTAATTRPITTMPTQQTAPVTTTRSTTRAATTQIVTTPATTQPTTATNASSQTTRATSVASAIEWITVGDREFYVNYNKSTYFEASEFCKLKLNSSLVAFTDIVKYFRLKDQLQLLTDLYWVDDAFYPGDKDCLQLDTNERQLSLTECTNKFYSICNRLVNQENVSESIHTPQFIRLLEEMTIDKRETHSDIRKHICADDKRKSAKTSGLVAFSVIVSMFTLMFIADISKFVTFIQEWWTGEAESNESKC